MVCTCMIVFIFLVNRKGKCARTIKKNITTSIDNFPLGIVSNILLWVCVDNVYFFNVWKNIVQEYTLFQFTKNR